jgi:hypothetical protein
VKLFIIIILELNITVQPFAKYFYIGWTAGCTVFNSTFKPGTQYCHVMWAHVMLRVQLGCERQFNIEFYGADSHFYHTAYITWSRAELWPVHVPERLSNLFSDTFCETCWLLFGHCYQLFPEMEDTLIEKVCQWTFLYDTKSRDYRDQHMRANAWEEMGKELEIKCKFYIFTCMCIFISSFIQRKVLKLV